MKNFKLSTVYPLFLFLTFFSFGVTSCQNDDDVSAGETSVSLNVEDSIQLNTGDTIEVIPEFQPNNTPEKSYTWETTSSGVVEITVSDDYSATIEAIGPGNTTIVFSSDDQEIQTNFNIEVSSDSPDDNVLKILAIGNSFSEDAVENYLYELAAAENIPVIIGNLYIGGASLELHWENAQNNNFDYDYRKITSQGKWVLEDTNIETALKDEDWDYISFQQVSGNSGQYETYIEPLSGLLSYTRERVTNPEVDYLLHQTWAYAVNSTHSSFPNYDSDQLKMYEAITDAARKVKTELDLDYLVPAGTAIQNGRNTFLGDTFTRDGYHLSLSIGRYTAASTWFEALTGINVVGNSFAPEGLNETEVAIAQETAHSAIENPDGVTLLEEYLPGNGGGVEFTVPINLNFGSNTVADWNTLNDYHEGATITNLKDSNNEFTNISVTVNERFNARNDDGEGLTDTALNMPEAISSQSFYGNFRGVWQDLEVKQSQLVLSGFDPDMTYEFCFFSSRGGVQDNRETKFIVEGDNSETLNLQASNNTSEIVCVNQIRPDNEGAIKITITAGDNNDNGSGFYYLNAMKVSPEN